MSTAAVSPYADYLKDIFMPASIRRLPIEPVRRVPIPWFVAWLDGKPEFRVVDPDKLVAAIKKQLCWVCGDKYGDRRAFVLGPMCIVNRTSAEPPCHVECATFSAVACPFLTKPHMVRRDTSDLVEKSEERMQAPAGVMIERNPGCCAVYVVRKHSFEGHRAGPLFHFEAPEYIRWYCEGRTATRAEVEHSIATGLPLLEKECRGLTDHVELARLVAVAKQYLPKR